MTDKQKERLPVTEKPSSPPERQVMKPVCRPGLESKAPP